VAYRRRFRRAQDAVALRLDLVVADVCGGDLFKLKPPLAVLGIHAEHRGAVFADTEVELRQIGHHAPPSSRRAGRMPQAVAAGSPAASAMVEGGPGRLAVMISAIALFQ